MSVLNTQVGGSHYTNMRCQPQYFCIVNNLNGCVMNFLKYTLRIKEDRILDLSKAMSCVNFAMSYDHHFAGKLYCPSISLEAFLEMNEVTGHTAAAIRAFFQRDWEHAAKFLNHIVAEELEMDIEEQEMSLEEAIAIANVFPFKK